MPPQTGGQSALEQYAEADARLSRLERHVAAQAAALRKAPLCMPVPPSVTALLSTAPEHLGATQLPAQYRPRVVKLVCDLQTMIDDLTVRQRELGGRIATVRSARRAGHSAHTVDYQG
jgi:hypothetical protein